MLKLFVYLGLVILAIPSRIYAINIDDLFTVQAGSTYGGCDAQLTALDDYLSDSIDGIATAQAALNHYRDRTDDGERIRTAVATWFGLPNPSNAKDLKGITDNLKFIGNFLNGFLTTEIPLAETFLFCDSTWLTQKMRSNTVQDWQGNDIVVNGNAVPISSVQAFKAPLKNRQTIPWFSGGHTMINGYYFTNANGGGNYCSNSANLGFTSLLQPLHQTSPNARPSKLDSPNNNVILCPASFTTNKPATYAAGRTSIQAGSNLDEAVPRSATLLHEVLHVVRGTFLLEGTDEIYGLAQCMRQAQRWSDYAMRNPENFVYFIVTMYYLFGEKLGGGGDPAGTRYWDFTDGPDNAQLLP